MAGHCLLTEDPAVLLCLVKQFCTYFDYTQVCYWPVFMRTSYGVLQLLPYWSMCYLQYSKFIKNGWTILNTADDNTLAATCPGDETNSTQVAIVVTNNGLVSVTADWSFGALVKPVSMEVYRTSATENFAQLPQVELPSTGLLEYALPPSTITTFYTVFTLAPAQSPPPATEEDLAEL